MALTPHDRETLLHVLPFARRPERSRRLPAANPTAKTPAVRPPHWLDRLADALRTRGYVAGLRQAYVAGSRRYLPFHRLRHPEELGTAAVAASLACVAENPDGPPAAEDKVRSKEGGRNLVEEQSWAPQPF